jgi:hypothetical protein
MSKTESVLGIAGIIGVLAIAGYFVYQATSAPTNQVSSSCNGDWTDNINPACLLGGLVSSSSNTINSATNEINVIVIIIAVTVLIVVAVLAFSPNGASLAGTFRSLV